MNRQRHYKKIYRNQLRKKIDTLPTQVFTRKDLTHDDSNRGQLRLNRALKIFLAEGSIIKISHGVYAKAMKMDFPGGEIKTVLQDDFESITTAALDKLNIKWELSRSIQAYNRGETTQIPALFSVKLKSRFRGTISAEGRDLVFEDGVNAR